MTTNVAAVIALVLFAIAAVMFVLDRAYGHALVSAGLAMLAWAALA